MISDRAKLLEELKDVDSETWKEIRYMLDSFRLEPLDIILEPKAYSDLIQGCIQRAIEATRSKEFMRDWFWEIEMLEKDEYEASIYDRENLLADVVASSPAAAILGAYVAARKAMR